MPYIILIILFNIFAFAFIYGCRDKSYHTSLAPTSEQSERLKINKI